VHVALLDLDQVLLVQQDGLEDAALLYDAALLLLGGLLHLRLALGGEFAHDRPLLDHLVRNLLQPLEVVPSEQQLVEGDSGFGEDGVVGAGGGGDVVVALDQLVVGGQELPLQDALLEGLAQGTLGLLALVGYIFLFVPILHNKGGDVGSWARAGRRLAVILCVSHYFSFTGGLACSIYYVFLQI
jgi:hypothetical protein